MIGISVCDIIFSLGWTLGPLPAPVATQIPGAHGNVASCSLQAFLIQLGLTSFCYNLMLMIYFCLIIRFKVREAVLVKRGIEPVMHAVSILYFGAVAVAGFPLQVYNPGPVGRCWIGVWPVDCLETPGAKCERGERSLFFAFWLVVVPLLIILFLVLFCLITVIVSVWQRYARSRRRTDLSELFGEGSMSFGHIIIQRSRIAEAGPAARETRLHITQCILYGLTITNALLWGCMGTIFAVAGQRLDAIGDDFWVLSLVIIFLSLQPLFNFLIFIRPRYLRKRQEQQSSSSKTAEGVQHPVGSRWRALLDAIGLYNTESSNNPQQSQKCQPRQANISSSAHTQYAVRLRDVEGREDGSPSSSRSDQCDSATDQNVKHNGSTQHTGTSAFPPLTMRDESFSDSSSSSEKESHSKNEANGNVMEEVVTIDEQPRTIPTVDHVKKVDVDETCSPSSSGNSSSLEQSLVHLYARALSPSSRQEGQEENHQDKDNQRSVSFANGNG